MSLLPLLLSLLFVLTACSGRRTEELKDFRSELSGFFERYEAYNETIASIDASDPNAKDILLSTADKMLADAKTLSALETPEDFVNFRHYAEEYGTHIGNAVSALHKAFGEETFDQAAFNTALPELDAAASSLSFMSAELRSAANNE